MERNKIGVKIHLTHPQEHFDSSHTQKQGKILWILNIQTKKIQFQTQTELLLLIHKQVFNHFPNSISLVFTIIIRNLIKINQIQNNNPDS